MSDLVGRSLEYRQQEIRRRARAALDTVNALAANSEAPEQECEHASGDGFEASRLFACPSLAWRLGEDLLDLLPADLRSRLDVVAGTSTAGIILAHTMAGLLDSRRPLAGPACRFAAFEGGAAGPLLLTPRAAAGLRERCVLLVDAIYEPGGRLQQAFHLACEAHADVGACAAICGPRRSPSDRHLPLITLCERQPGWCRNL